MKKLMRDAIMNMYCAAAVSRIGAKAVRPMTGKEGKSIHRGEDNTGGQ